MEKNEQVPWRYNGDQEVVIPDWAIGFIYVITHKIGSKELLYVGKKILVSSRRKRIGVREKKATKTRKTYKVEKKDSGWESYWGSSKSLHSARETGEGAWQRTIVEWCHSKKQMSYNETKWQFLMKSLEVESYNDHIQNWYRKDLQRPETK